jgi:RNA-directed DNA polymerase
MINISELFSALFSESSLVEVFREKFAGARAKGIDRLNGFQFSTRAEAELRIASVTADSIPVSYAKSGTETL